MKTFSLNRHASWLLVLLTLAILLPGLGTLPLLDRDEPRFATATREMMTRGDWIVPTFNGAERFDKPILIYWMMAASYAVFGVGEFAARVPTVVSMLVLVLFVWRTGRRWFGEWPGFLAAAALASSLQFVIHGRIAVADMPMVTAVTIAMVAGFELLAAPESDRRRWWWTLWLAMGLGFLAKGPIAWAVPIVAVLIFRFACWRRPLVWGSLRALPGGLVAVGIVAVWAVPALLATDGRFLLEGIGKHVVARGMEGFDNRGYSPVFYLGSVPLSLFPWCVFIPAVILCLRRNWDAPAAWCVAWFVAPIAIFTPYATQLPHYVLPGFPAFFLLLGRTLCDLRFSRWIRAPGVGLSLLAIGLVGAAAWCFFVFRSDPARVALARGVGGMVLMLVGLAMVGWSLPAKRGLAVVSALAIFACGTWVAAKAMRVTSLSVHIASIAEQQPDSIDLVGIGFAEPSLVFYSGRRWRFVSADDVSSCLRDDTPSLVVSLERECEPLGWMMGRPHWSVAKTWQPPEDGSWETLHLEGFNPGRSRWQEVAVAVRRN